MEFKKEHTTLGLLITQTNCPAGWQTNKLSENTGRPGFYIALVSSANSFSWRFSGIQCRLDW